MARSDTPPLVDFRLLDQARAMRLHRDMAGTDGVEDSSIRLIESADQVMQEHGFYLSGELQSIRREIELVGERPDTPEDRHLRRYDREHRLSHLRAAEESALGALAELRSDRTRLKRIRQALAASERQKREAWK